MNLTQSRPLSRGRALSRGRQRGENKDRGNKNNQIIVLTRRSPTWGTETDSVASESSFTPTKGLIKTQQSEIGTRRSSPKGTSREKKPIIASGGRKEELKLLRESHLANNNGITRSYKIFCGRSEQSQLFHQKNAPQQQQQHFIMLNPTGTYRRNRDENHTVTSQLENEEKKTDCPDEVHDQGLPSWVIASSNSTPKFSFGSPDYSFHECFADFSSPQHTKTYCFSSASSQFNHQRAAMNTSRAFAMPSTLSPTSTAERDPAVSVGDCSSVSWDLIDYNPCDEKEETMIQQDDSNQVESSSLMYDSNLQEGFQRISGFQYTTEASFHEGSLDRHSPEFQMPSLVVRAKSADGYLSETRKAFLASRPKRQDQPEHGRTKSLGREEFTFMTNDTAETMSSNQSLGSVEISSKMVVRGEAETEYTEETAQPESRSFGEGAAMIMSTMMNSPLINLPENKSDGVEKIPDLCLSPNVKKLASYYGKNHTRVADALIDEGVAHIQASSFAEASIFLESAIDIYRQRNSFSMLALARALHHLGTAYHKLESSQDVAILCSKSLKCFAEALKIRYEELGPMHPDTAATVNCLGGIYMTARIFQEARRSYLEVLSVRQAVFGISHPSVAVAAHSLANASLYLGDLEEATIYYCKALDIYEALGLRQDHPSLARLLRDMTRMQRLQET